MDQGRSFDDLACEAEEHEMEYWERKHAQVKEASSSKEDERNENRRTGAIRIGSQYQANVPPLIVHHPSLYCVRTWFKWTNVWTR